MRHPKFLQNVLIGSAAALFAGTSVVSHQPAESGPVLRAATAFVTGKPDAAATTASTDASSPAAEVASATKSALDALASSVTKLSSPEALEDAFHSYYAYKTEHPDDVKKPYLYFVDYGLASTEARGYVFDMSSLKIVDGPFTVAHGRGSSTSRYGVPTKFSNASGSDATSLGLYVTKALYAFHGHTGGRAYSSVGVKLDGVSTGFNDKALGRGVVAHGAPYVTEAKAGRSEGCPAMEPARAQRLLPKLADGSLVFLYAPNQQWLAGDPWISADSDG